MRRRSEPRNRMVETGHHSLNLILTTSEERPFMFAACRYAAPAFSLRARFQRVHPISIGSILYHGNSRRSRV
ncbi:hypothetical protein SBA4_1980026 [Candidatus Sulfopaludibacter sp. SbA4]|nr:hypothetical protein SBA4_1980026 [Candidatus Sulfopaludibacter sp. SbA4]